VGARASERVVLMAGQTPAQWWVIPEGTIGQSISQFIHDFESGSPSSVQGIGALYTVTQAASKPSGAMSGPYSTKAKAQAAADALNGTITSSTQQTPQNVGSGITGWLSQGSLWMRIGEILVGLVLLGIGVNSLLKGAPLKVVTSTAGIAAKVVP
jgi:hypothetical protein